MSEIKMSDVFGSSINEDPINRIVQSMILFGPEKDAAIHAISQHDNLAEQNKALKAALYGVFEIAGRSNEQNMANFDTELAAQHNEDINEIYHIAKEALEQANEG